MKVHSFNNSVPPLNENNKNDTNINRQSAKNPKNSNIPVHPESNAGAQTEKISPTPDIRNNNDRIEISFGSRGAAEKQGKAQNAVYSIKNVRGWNSDPPAADKSARFADIRRKIADGYYDSPEFIEKLAEKLTTIFNMSEE